jgi:hypothetical protein
MASEIAELGRAGVAGLPKSKSQAQIFLQRSLRLWQRRTHPGALTLAPSPLPSPRSGRGIQDRERDSGQGDGLLANLCRPARGRRGGGFEYHASILPESLRVAIYQHELQFAAGPADAVPAAASSPLQTATAPGRDLSGAKRNERARCVQNQKAEAPSPSPLPGQGEGLEASRRDALSIKMRMR